MNVEKLAADLATHVSKQNISREANLTYQCSAEEFFFPSLVTKNSQLLIFSPLEWEVQKFAMYLENRTLNDDFELPLEKRLAASLQEGIAVGIHA